MKTPMSTMPLGRRKRADEIAEHIERAISTGEFKEGAPMPSEKELAERFGVGRPSVRQAIFTLQQQGLVEITSGTRARVTAPSGKFLTGQLASLIRRMTSTGQGHEHMERTRLLFEAAVAWQGCAGRHRRGHPAPENAAGCQRCRHRQYRPVHTDGRGFPRRTHGHHAQPDIHGSPRRPADMSVTVRASEEAAKMRG